MKPDIIIIDDEEIVLMLIKRLVVKAGLHNSPQLFSNGMDGLNYLQSQNGRKSPILIFLDINMPGFDGWEFLELLQTFSLDFPAKVVIITSSVNQSDKVKSKTYGSVIGYIEKPVTEDMMKGVAQLEGISNYFE
jgi:CheY-like chemotaxis protein